MKKKTILLLGALFLGGCMSTPSETQISTAYYGELPVNYKELIQSAVGSGLKDPGSAEYQFGEPRKAYLQGGLSEDFKMYYGWAVPVSFNAKNSYGAYVGYSTSYYMFINGQLTDATLKFKSGYAKSIQ